MAQEFQIHGEKRGVIDGVDIPQLIVELQAVE